MVWPRTLVRNSRCPPQDLQNPFRNFSLPRSTRSLGRWVSGGGAGFGAAEAGVSLLWATTGAGVITGGIGGGGSGIGSGARLTGSGAPSCRESSIGLILAVGACGTGLGASWRGRLSCASSVLSSLDNRTSSCSNSVCRCLSRSKSDRACSFMPLVVRPADYQSAIQPTTSRRYYQAYGSRITR